MDCYSWEKKINKHVLGGWHKNCQYSTDRKGATLVCCTDTSTLDEYDVNR